MQVVPFFGNFGFVIPERKEVADFLQVGWGQRDGR